MTDDDRVFKALADPTRRFLLDRLFARDGRTLTELESELEMTRFGVMKHLRVLEDAGLVVTRRSGREKLHFLNPVPIRLIHDRWIDKYTERQVSALADLKHELEAELMTSDHAGRPPPRRSTASTSRRPRRRSGTRSPSPSGPNRYGYGGFAEYDLRPGGPYRDPRERARWPPTEGVPDVVVDGEVIEADPPRKLVQTWRMLMDPAMAAEGFTRLTYEIEETRRRASASSPSPTSSRARRSWPRWSRASSRTQGAGGGWAWVLSDLKSLLETGKRLAD